MKRFREGSISRPVEEGEEHEQIRLVSTPEPPIICQKMNELSSTNGSKSFISDHKLSICDESNYSNSPRDIYAQCIIQQSESRKSQGFFSQSKKCKCRPIEWFLSLFPIFAWLPKYNWKSDLSYDLVAGMTICVMNIPQGMGYALLANLQPVVGIYMSFFPIIVYTFMGTSKHISLGTFAVVCLMTGKVATERMTSYASPILKVNDSSLHSQTYLVDDNAPILGSPYTAEQIATAVSFAVGIFQILMGTLKLGSLSVLLSAELVSGFTTGAAVHVFTSQIKNLLGLSLPRRNGMFKIPLTYADVISNISNVNVTAVIFSIVTLSCLIIYNEVLKPIISKKISVPIPVELFTIVIGTVVSKYWITSSHYNLPIVDHIPTGLPTPSLPPIEILQDVALDSLLISIVAYTITISMGKIFAAKHEYVVRPNQELIANGASNFVGSFFMCAPISASLSRSLIQEQVGGKTQIAGLFSCFLMVFVLMWIGPLFETLPHCVLASMIVVALKGMFLQFHDLPKAYKESHLNALTWLAAFVATVFLDIEYGLLIGLILSIFTLLWQSNKSNITVLGLYPNSNNVFVDMSAISQAKELEKIKIVKYTGSLNFATVELFAEKIQKIMPTIEPRKKRGSTLGGILVSTISKEKINDNISMDDNLCDFQPSMVHNSSWIILDFSSMSSIDPAGIRVLISLWRAYLKRDIQLLFSGCPPTVLAVMDKCNFIKIIGIQHFFPSVSDAVNFCASGLESDVNSNNNAVMA